MADVKNHDGLVAIADLEDHAVVADSDAPSVATRQREATGRSRVWGQDSLGRITVDADRLPLQALTLCWKRAYLILSKSRSLHPVDRGAQDRCFM